LSSVVTFDNDWGKDVRARVAAGNQYYQALLTAVKLRHLPKHTKLKISTMVIKQRVLNGCETWAVTQPVKSSLKTWERKILRKM
jgi:hypothetical protein